MARHLLDTSSTPCCLSRFFSCFLSLSRQILNTLWIDWESSCLFDRSLIPGGSIELLFLDLMSCCSILARYLGCRQAFFSIPTSTASLTPLDTSSVELYWVFYISLLVRSEPHFTRYLSWLLSVFSPKLSHLTPISILKGFFKIFQDFLLLVSF